MSIGKLTFVAAVATLTVTLPGYAAAEERLTGTWLTEDKSSHVVFQPCGANDCGKIVWLHEPIDPESGQAWKDKFNPDDALKRRPLIELTMVADLKPAGPSRWEGALYNPLDGKMYAGSFQNIGPDKLKLKGCAFAGLVCQTEIWTRVRP